MSAAVTSPEAGEKKGSMLDLIEKLGNKVPHPVLMFLYLIIFVIVLSAILSLAGVSVTEHIAVPYPNRWNQITTKTPRSLGLSPIWRH